MIQTKLKGMGVALITPFKEDESVDYDALMRLVDYLLQNNADFLCVLGTTAETPTLTEEDLSGYTDKLAGQSIVISGVFVHHSRDEYKELIEKNGGKNVGSISAKTSFILAGDNMGPAKLEKAKKLGITILSEDEFLKLIS